MTRLCGARCPAQCNAQIMADAAAAGPAWRLGAVRVGMPLEALLGLGARLDPRLGSGAAALTRSARCAHAAPTRSLIRSRAGQHARRAAEGRTRPGQPFDFRRPCRRPAPKNPDLQFCGGASPFLLKPGAGTSCGADPILFMLLSSDML